jgi:hypothetical protein
MRADAHRVLATHLDRYKPITGRSAAGSKRGAATDAPFPLII